MRVAVARLAEALGEGKRELALLAEGADGAGDLSARASPSAPLPSRTTRPAIRGSRPAASSPWIRSPSPIFLSIPASTKGLPAVVSTTPSARSRVSTARSGTGFSNFARSRRP